MTITRTLARALAATALAALAGTGCATMAAHVPAGPAPAYNPDPSDDCPAGDVVVSWVDGAPGCDLVGGVNRLVYVDISTADCDLVGGVHDGDDGCVGADF